MSSTSPEVFVEGLRVPQGICTVGVSGCFFLSFIVVLIHGVEGSRDSPLSLSLGCCCGLRPSVAGVEGFVCSFLSVSFPKFSSHRALGKSCKELFVSRGYQGIRSLIEVGVCEIESCQANMIGFMCGCEITSRGSGGN